MKRFFALFLAFIICVGAMAGCGSKTENTPAAVTETASKNSEPIKFEFWHSMSGDMEKTLLAMVDEFNASQDKYYCEALYQGTYYEASAKIQAAMVTNDAPALVQMECLRVVMFQEEDVIRDLTDLVDAHPEIEYDDFQKAFMDNCEFNGGIWAIPFNRSTPICYYNVDLFKEMGLEVPTTWEELHETAKALSIKDKRWGFECPIDTWFYECMVIQSGGSLFNEEYTSIGFENKAGTEPLYFWREMLADGSMRAPAGQEYGSWDIAKADFPNGVCGMVCLSTGNFGGLRSASKFEVGAFFLPANIKHGVVTGGANLMIIDGVPEEQIEGAFELILFLTTAEKCAEWSAATGYVPVKKGVENTKIWKDHVANIPAAQVSLDQMAYGDVRPVHPDYNEIHTVTIMNAIQKCMMDESYTPEQCVADIADGVEAFLAK